MKKRGYLIAAITLFIATRAHAQIPFNYTIDLQGNTYINFTMSDTFAYLGAGGVNTGGNTSNIMLSKYNEVGTLEWLMTYGPGTATSVGFDPGGYIIAASSTAYSTSGDTNIVLIRTDRSGNVRWAKNYGGDSTFVPAHIISLSSPLSGFLITGRTTGFGNGGSDMLVMKTDTSGNLQWQRAFGSAGYETGAQAYVYPDTTFYITGSSNGGGAGGNDIFLVHIGTSGNLISQYLIGTPFNDEGKQVWPYSDSVLYLLGNTSGGVDSTEDILLTQLKIKGTDSIIWARTYGDSGADIGSTVEATLQQADGNLVIITGSTSSYSDSMKAFALLADTLGNLQGELAFGGTGSNYVTDARLTNNGLMMGGYSSSYTPSHNYAGWMIEVDGFSTCDDSVVNPIVGTPALSVNGPAPAGFSSATGNINSNTINVTATQVPDSEWSNCYIVIPLEAGTGYNKIICRGDSVNIGGNPTAQYGVPPYHYQWAPSTGLNNDTIANPYANPISYTTYTVTVTDSIGETATAAISVSVLSCQPLVVKAGDDTLICSGQSLLLGGNPTATGGNPPYHYRWSPSTGLSNDTVANPTATPVASTTYTLSVTDGFFNDSASASIQIIVSTCTQLSVNAGDDTTLCPNQNDTLGGHPTASGGTPPYTYLWQPPTGLSSNTVSNPFATPYADTSVYVLTVTDAESLFAIDTVILYSSTCMGIREQDISYLADIYPNPNNGKFEIRFTDVKQVIALKIFDMSGRCIYNSNSSLETGVLLNLDQPAAGCYVLAIETALGVLHKRLVIEK